MMFLPIRITHIPTHAAFADEAEVLETIPLILYMVCTSTHHHMMHVQRFYSSSKFFPSRYPSPKYAEHHLPSNHNPKENMVYYGKHHSCSCCSTFTFLLGERRERYLSSCFRSSIRQCLLLAVSLHLVAF